MIFSKRDENRLSDVHGDALSIRQTVNNTMAKLSVIEREMDKLTRNTNERHLALDAKLDMLHGIVEQIAITQTKQFQPAFLTRPDKRRKKVKR